MVVGWDVIKVDFLLVLLVVVGGAGGGSVGCLLACLAGWLFVSVLSVFSLAKSKKIGDFPHVHAHARFVADVFSFRFDDLI